MAWMVRMAQSSNRSLCEERTSYFPETEKRPSPSIQNGVPISGFFVKCPRFPSDVNNAKFDFRCDQFLRGLQLSIQEIYALHDETIAHGGRRETEGRKRLTDSSFGRVYKMKNTTPPSILVRELLAVIDPITGYEINNVMDGGKNDQSVAIAQYVTLTQQLIRPAGLIVHREFGYLAAAPTALIQDNGNDGILKIKYPSYARLMHPLEISQYLHHFCCSLSEDRSRMTLNTDHYYYYQIQGMLEIVDREWCDFVIWTTRGIHVERIWRDRNVWLEMFPKLETFYKLSLLPEIIDSRLNRQLPVREPDFVSETIDMSRNSKQRMS